MSVDDVISYNIIDIKSGPFKFVVQFSRDFIGCRTRVKLLKNGFNINVKVYEHMTLLSKQCQNNVRKSCKVWCL